MREVSMVAPIEEPNEPEVTWSFLQSLPRERRFNQEEYLAIANATNYRVELCDGRIDLLPWSTRRHQDIVQWFGMLLMGCSDEGLGEVVIGPYPLRLGAATFRQPDLVFALPEHVPWLTEEYATGADLVVEIVEREPDRELTVKRREYAAAGIREYWLVNALDGSITVLVRRNGEYVVQSNAVDNGIVTSSLVPMFSVDASEIAMLHSRVQSRPF